MQAYVAEERIASAKAKGKVDGKSEGGSLISLYERGKVSAAEVAEKLKISEKIIRIVYNVR